MIAPGTDVIAPSFASQAALPALRGAFAASAPRMLFLPDALLVHAGAALLESAEGGARRDQAVADRGSYRQVELPPSPFVEILGEFAAAVAGEPLSVGRAVLRELRPGDYALMKDDARSRPPGAFLELMVDLSPVAAGVADLVYVSPEGAHLAVPQQPLGLLLVERRPGMLRHERYTSLRHAGALVRRLYLALLPSGGQPAGSGVVGSPR